MAIPTPLLPPIEEDELDTTLQIKSVKQLPQSKQVPILYSSTFQSNEIIDTHLVIKAIRQDVLALQQLLIEPINLHLDNYHVVITEMLVRLDEIDVIQDDFELRITALENP